MDGLRALAVTAVVIFHAFPPVLPGGYLGVDVFFVISGFLITDLLVERLRTQTLSLFQFYLGRARRLLPALFLVLAASLFLGWLILSPSDFVSLGKNIIAALCFISNLLLWNEVGYFDPSSKFKPLLHLWSLGVEEQFYLFWPILVIFAFRRRAVIRFIVGAGMLSLLIYLILLQYNASAAFYFPLARLWELAIGAALSQFAGQVRRPQLAGCTGLALLLASIVIIREPAAVSGLFALPASLGAALLIIGGPQSTVGKALSWRPMVLLGLISYPLYLWHWPLLTFARIVNGADLNEWQTVGVLVASTVAAGLTYVFVEKPLRTKLLTWRPNIQITTFVGLSAIFGLMAFSVSASILTQNTPTILRSIDAVRLDRSVWRADRCFLGTSGGVFKPECFEDAPATKPLVVLWGDSYAAALYPGINAQSDRKRFRLTQLTFSSCPPLLNIPNPANTIGCDVTNHADIDYITRVRPDVVILSARWFFYPLNKLPETIRRLKAAGAKRIVLVGIYPNWDPGLPAILSAAYRKTGSVPLRINQGSALMDLDLNLRHEAKLEGIEFASVMALLCDANGCLTHIGADQMDLTSFDTGHLTPSTAKFVVSRIRTNLGKPLAF